MEFLKIKLRRPVHLFILVLIPLIIINHIVDSYPTGDSSDSEIPGEPLNPDDFEAAKKYTRDLALGLIQVPEDEPMDEKVTRNVNKPNPGLWTLGKVPYEISKNIESDTHRTIIAKATAAISAGTCIKFVPRVKAGEMASNVAPNVIEDTDYLVIKRDTKGTKGCSSYVGRVGGRQVTIMSDRCLSSYGSTIHELMHVLGFEHEHQRSDRDNFITVHDDRIIPALRPQFEIISQTENTKTTYDLGSILHYSEGADCQPPCFTNTIEPKKPYIGEIGQRNDLSALDKEKITKTYNCNKDIAPMQEQVPPLQSISSILPGILFPKGMTSPQDCIDFDKRCANVDLSECGKNQTWINFNCRKTCNTCDFTTSCTDYNPKCEYWSRQNFCESYPEYMAIFCQKSCQNVFNFGCQM